MKSRFLIFLSLFSLIFTSSATFAAGDITIIDVMVLYTPAAETAANQADQIPMTKWIPQAVAATNQALSNSEAHLRIDLVHSQKINYLESTNEVDLQNLTGGKGSLRDVAQLRDYYHADLVILVTNNMQGGQAESLMSLVSDFKCNRFAVVKQGYISVFVHELGHLLGAQHDETINGALEKSIYPYAHGYTGGTWLPNTIVGGYQDVQNGIGKISFYSNPNLKYRDQPLGDPNTGDNVRTFNTTAPVIAECKSSIVTWTGAVSDRWTDSRNWSNNYVPRKIDDVDIPYGLTRYPVISNGEQYARSLVVDRGATLTITAGNLLVRGALLASGGLVANGGSIQLLSIDNLPTEIKLSDNSKIADLIIGKENDRTWVKVLSKLNIEKGIIIKPNSLFDPGENQIIVKGNLKGQGNGIDLGNKNLSIQGSKEIESSSILLPIQATSDGFYSSDHPGFLSLIEFGNQGYKWSFGGEEGQAMLWTKGKYYLDDPRYMDQTDSWLILPAVALQKGLSYEFSFEAKTQQSSELFDYAVYYGKSQLPSKMIPAIPKKRSKNDNNWAMFDGILSLPESGIYYIGIRATIPDTKYENQTYIRNLKLKTVEDKPQVDCSAALGTIKFTDYIPIGNKLFEGERLVSANGKYQLRFDPGETYVIEEIVNSRNCELKKIWSTRPLNFPINNPPIATYLTFKADDGNVCVVSKLGSGYCFTSGRDENVGLLYNSERLQLTNNGRLVLLNKSGAEVWSNRPPTDDGLAEVKYQTVMKPGDFVEEGESLISQNGEYQLRVNTSNRLVIENIDPATGTLLTEVWKAPFTGRSNSPNVENRFWMNPDCNVCFDSKLGQYFCITTGRDENVKILNQCGELTLTNSGHLIMYSKMGVELWRSH